MKTKTYSEAHCWQYDIRLKNLENDLFDANLTLEETKNLKVSDFKFQYVSKDDSDLCLMVTNFIKKHEWLGIMPKRPTHRFISTYKGHLLSPIFSALVYHTFWLNFWGAGQFRTVCMASPTQKGTTYEFCRCVVSVHGIPHTHLYKYAQSIPCFKQLPYSLG